MSSQLWNVEETNNLRSLLETAKRSLAGKLKKGEGKRIASFFPNRSQHSVEQHIAELQRSSEPVEKRTYKPWSEEETVKLRSLYSENKWRLGLKEIFPDRDPRDTREKARQLGLNRKILKTEAKELTKEQAALMAGLLMADGCLSHRHAYTNRKIHTVTISFSNTDPEMVELFASMASNCRVRSYAVDPNKSFKPTKLTHYECDINSKEAVHHTLKQILPYLVGAKLAKAREMLICLEGGHKDN